MTLIRTATVKCLLAVLLKGLFVLNSKQANRYTHSSSDAPFITINRNAYAHPPTPTYLLKFIKIS
jgi:hypothetical protein